MPSEKPLFSEDIEVEEGGIGLATAFGRVLQRVVEKITRDYVSPFVKWRGELRSVLSPMRWSGCDSTYVSVLAVDSTWTVPHLELVAGRFALIATGYLILTPGAMGECGIARVAVRWGSAEEEASFTYDVSLDAHISDLIVARMKLENDIDIVLIDGALYKVNSPAYFEPELKVDIVEAKKHATGQKLARLASAALLKLLRKADDVGAPVVGVVKRVSSKLLLPIVHRLGKIELDETLVKTNDKLLATTVLEPGEYIVIRNYLKALKDTIDTLEKLDSVLTERLGKSIVGPRVRKVREIIETYRQEQQRLSSETIELMQRMENTAVIYYMHKGDMVYPQATRIDVYPSDVVDEVLNYAMTNTSENAVLTPIDYVDRFVRLETATIRRVYLLLKHYVKDKETSKALNPTNPQKSYLYLRKER